MAIAEAAAVVTTLKNAADLVQKLRGSDSKEELQAGVATLTEMLVNARVAALDILTEKAMLMDERTTLNRRIDALEREVRHLVDFDEQSQKYERVRTHFGKFVYRERNPAGGNAGAPYFCPKCYTDKKASVLQGRVGDTFHVCPVCRWCDEL
jgi:hypothetical protein